MNILFLCVANSARSQLAEGVARHILAEKATVASAGSHPTAIHPLTKVVLKEIGMDARGQFSKSIADLDAGFVAKIDFVVTLCAEEVCPVLPGKAKRLHWPLVDPAAEKSSKDEQRLAFRRVRDELLEKINSLANLME